MATPDTRVRHDAGHPAGHPPEQRMGVAQALCRHCIDTLGLHEDRLKMEFTQHSGDEMCHPALGSYSPEWEAGEQ